MRARVRAARKAGLWDVRLEGLTKGELLSLRNALVRHAAISPVAGDLLAFFESACGDDGAVLPRTVAPTAEDAFEST